MDADLRKFFYLLFASCLFLEPLRRLAALSVILIALVVAGSFYQGTNAIAISLTRPIFLEFLIGISIAECVRRGWTPALGWGYALIALSGLLLAVFALDPVDQPRLIAWGLPAAMLVAGAVVVEVRGRLPEWPTLRLIGDSSYSLYLTHGLALSALGKLMGHSWLFTIVGVGLAIGVGIVVWHLVERPITATLRKRLSPTRMTPVRPVPHLQA